VRWNLAGWLALGSVPARLPRVIFLKFDRQRQPGADIVSVALGSVLLLAVGALVLKDVPRPSQRQPAPG